MHLMLILKATLILEGFREEYSFRIIKDPQPSYNFQKIIDYQIK